MSLDLIESATGASRIDYSTSGSMAWIGDSVVALLDVHAGRVVLHDIYSGEVSTIGRSGDGPGEFQWPIRMYASASGEFLVADSRTGRLSLLDANGNFVVGQQMKGMPLQIFQLQDSVATFARMEFSGVAGPIISSLDLATGELEDLFSLFAADDRLADLGRESGTSILTLTGDAKGRYYAGNGTEYRIVEFDSSGSRVTVFARSELDPLMPTEQDAARMRSGLEDMAASGVPVSKELIDEQVQEFRTRPKPFFRLNSLAVDSEQRLWVLRADSDSSGTSIDLFDRSGQYEQTLEVRDRALALAMNDSLVAVLTVRLSGPWEGLNSVDIYHVRGRDD